MDRGTLASLCLLFLLSTPMLWAQPTQGLVEVLDPQQGSFEQHVREARELNRARKTVYASLSGGTSLEVSDRLILLETLTLPVARSFDRRARQWNAQGLGVIRDDFAPMTQLPKPGTPPRWRGRVGLRDYWQLVDELKRLCLRLEVEIFTRDFLTVARESRQAILHLQEREQALGCHFAMTIHLLEQICFSAANAVAYGQASGGETDGLMADFLSRLPTALVFGAWLDRQAQKSHQLGVGILVNDLPAIPFEEAWRRIAP